MEDQEKNCKEETEVEMDGSVEGFTPYQPTEDVKMESFEVKGMIIRRRMVLNHNII